MGPVGGDTKNPLVVNIPMPKDWYAVDFDDSKWPNARDFTEEEIGPKSPFFEHDFDGAKFIWSDDVKLDNVVLFRTVVKSPTDGTDRPDFTVLQTLSRNDHNEAAAAKVESQFHIRIPANVRDLQER